jgi:ParB-like chromosome segregation protein Spo0J
VAKLLDNGIQPFYDLDEVELTSLGEAIGRQRALAVPVVITSDGILIDGHQRLKALLTQGVKSISADSVRIVDKANATNALEWAVELNVKRRHLTVDQKADVARRLQAERGWSQAKIAQLFGVSRPAVSKWLATVPDDDDDRTVAVEVPAMVEGLDGKSYPTPSRATRPPLHPWRSAGHAFKAVAKARQALEKEAVDGLDQLERVRLIAELGDLIAAAEERLSELGEP